MTPRLLQLCQCTAHLACSVGKRTRAPWPAGRQLRAAAHSGRVEPPDVRKLAKMAQISVTDEEARGCRPVFCVDTHSGTSLTLARLHRFATGDRSWSR